MRLMSVIYHLGSFLDVEDITEPVNRHASTLQGITTNSGHYVSIVRTEKYGWLLCNDHEFKRLPQFPRHLRHAIVLFFEKVG
jgi:hypothetical protein